jgi:lipopolysaccharide assembly outer membrane protein LptD (OstA)
MKPLALALLAISPFVGLAQKDSIPFASPNQIALSADQEIKDGLGMKLRGNVQIKTNSLIVYADEADYNPITGELEPRGHVRVSFKNATPHIRIQDSSPEDAPANIFHK